MKLSEWCKQKMESAKDGDEAYAYHQMMEMWLSREGSSGISELDTGGHKTSEGEAVEDKG